MNPKTCVWLVPLSPRSSPASGPTTLHIHCESHAQVLQLWNSWPPSSLHAVPPIWHNSLHTFAGRPSSSFGSSLTIQKSHPCYSSIPFSFSWSMCSFVYMEGWTSSWSPQEQQISLDHHCNPRTQHKVAQRVVTQEVFLPIHRWGN